MVMDIMGEVDNQLQAKGLTKTTDNPDLLVNAYGALDGSLNVSYDVNVYAMPGLDPDQQEKSLEIIEKAIIKMFKQYPSK
jgi:hypothetical protein